MDGQTDMSKLTVAYRNFAKAPKNQWLSIEHNMYFLYTRATITRFGL